MFAGANVWYSSSTVSGATYVPRASQVRNHAMTVREQVTKWHHLLENVEYVYFIGSGPSRPVKIGYSSDPNKRLNNLRNASPDDLKLLAVLPGSRQLERHFHRMFEDEHLRGEWFQGDSVDEMVTLLGIVGPASIEEFHKRGLLPYPCMAERIRPRCTAVSDHKREHFEVTQHSLALKVY